MFGRIGAALVCLLCALPVFAHEPIVLDARRATPGLRLELTELPRTADSAVPRYRMYTVGLPRGVIFGVWTKDFGHSFHELASGFQVDEFGNLVSSKTGRPQRLEEMSFEAGPYPRGAIWEVALVSVDRALTAFAKVIPYPITARDGPCTLSLELVTQRGERFVASGAGFPPGEEVITQSQYSESIIQKRRRISPEGLLPPDVVSHAAIGSDRSARYTIIARSCQVVVDYEWGEAALVRR
jgi:hypothetical protein